MSLWRSTLITICPFYTSSLISIILLWCVRHGTTTDRYLIWSDKLSFHFTIQSDISRMGKFPVLVKHATATPLSMFVNTSTWRWNHRDNACATTDLFSPKRNAFVEEWWHYVYFHRIWLTLCKDKPMNLTLKWGQLYEHSSRENVNGWA